MGKQTKDKKGPAKPRVDLKKKRTPKMNPFESRVLKEKSGIVSAKRQAHTTNPGKARARAEAKREATIGVELSERGRTTTVIDRRFTASELNKLNDEEKALVALQKARQHALARTGGLDDEDLGAESMLTHGGRKLTLENLSDPSSDSIDSDSDDDNARFGGFLRRGKQQPVEEEPLDKEGKKRKEEVMRDLISKSKASKLTHQYEQQSKRAKVMNQTEVVDHKLGDILDLLVKNKTNSVKTKNVDTKANHEPEDEEPEENEDIDEDSDEAEGEESQSPNPSSKTAPADDFEALMLELENAPKSVPSDPLLTAEAVAQAERKRLDQLEAARLRRMGADGEELIGDDVDAPVLKKRQKQAKVAASADLAGDDLWDGYALHMDNSNSDDDDDDESSKPSTKQNSKLATGEIADDAVEEFDEAAEGLGPLSPTEALPYTYRMPASRKEFGVLLENQSPSRQNTILTRLRACYHLSLRPTNKQQLQKLMKYILRQVQVWGKTISQPMESFDILNTHFYQLAHQQPLAAGELSREFITQIRELHLPSSMSHSLTDVSPLPSSALMSLLLLSHVWPLSDRRHVVATPLILCLSEALNRAKIESIKDGLCVLFMANIFLEQWIAKGSRFASEPLIAAHKVIRLFLASPEQGFSISLPSNLKKYKLRPPSIQNLSESSQSEKTEAALSLLSGALSLISHYFTNSVSPFDPASVPLLSETEQLLNALEVTHSLTDSSDVTTLKDTLTKLVEHASTSLVSMQLWAPKIAPIKEYTPDFQENYTSKKASSDKVSSRDAREAKRLRREHQRSKKGAERELRLDAKFYARKQINKRKADEELQSSRVKAIRSVLETQQHDAKVEARLKGKLKL